MGELSNLKTGDPLTPQGEELIRELFPAQVAAVVEEGACWMLPIRRLLIADRSQRTLSGSDKSHLNTAIIFAMMDKEFM